MEEKENIQLENPAEDIIVSENEGFDKQEEVIDSKISEEIIHVENEKDLEKDKEQFASNDAMIIYTFTADELKIKGGETNLPEDVLKEVERRYFESEEEELIHKEVYTKWKQEMN